MPGVKPEKQRREALMEKLDQEIQQLIETNQPWALKGLREDLRKRQVDIALELQRRGLLPQ